MKDSKIQVFTTKIQDLFTINNPQAPVMSMIFTVTEGFSSLPRTEQPLYVAVAESEFEMC